MFSVSQHQLHYELKAEDEKLIKLIAAYVYDIKLDKIPEVNKPTLIDYFDSAKNNSFPVKDQSLLMVELFTAVDVLGPTEFMRLVQTKKFQVNFNYLDQVRQKHVDVLIMGADLRTV